MNKIPVKKSALLLRKGDACIPAHLALLRIAMTYNLGYRVRACMEIREYRLLWQRWINLNKPVYNELLTLLPEDIKHAITMTYGEPDVVSEEKEISC